jgi:hypothetical protein
MPEKAGAVVGEIVLKRAVHSSLMAVSHAGVGNFLPQ